MESETEIMADVPEVERKNSATSALGDLAAASRKRVAPPSTQAAFTTLPNGSVLDRSGKQVYTPTPREERKP